MDKDHDKKPLQLASATNVQSKYKTDASVAQSQQLMYSDKPKPKSKMQNYGHQSVLDDLDDDFDI